MKNKKIFIYIISIICILSIIPFIIISFYSRPSADDFDYSYTLYNLIQSGNYNIISILIESFKMMATVYKTWQGTYSSAIIMSLQTGIWGDKYYSIGTILLMIFMYICLYRLFYIINKRVINNYLPTWFLSLLFFTILLQTAPYICQCLYWQCGAYHYVPFFFLDLVIVSYAIDYLNEENKNKRIKDLVISSLLSFIVSGGNQVTSFLNMLILFIAILYCFVFKKDKGLIITLIVSIIGFMIMFFAPGNTTRIDATVQTNVFVAILNSFKGAFKYARIWPSLAWLSFIIFMIVAFIPFINTYDKQLNVNPVIVVVLSFLLYAAMFCPTNYAMSTNGPGRLKNVIYFACVFFSIFDCIYTLIWIKQKHNIQYKYNIKIASVLLVLFSAILCFSMSNNVTKINNELLDGTAENFAKSYDNRIKYMNESSLDIVVVDKLPESEILKFDDITSNIDDWRNASWSKYYGIKTITKE